MKRIVVTIAAFFPILNNYAYSLLCRIGNYEKKMEQVSSLVLYSYEVQNMKTACNSPGTHVSHAAHFSSSITYNHSVNKINVKKICLNSIQITKICEIIEKATIGYSVVGYKRKCSNINIESCYLETIDNSQVNKSCYRIHFMMEYYSVENVHSHCYYEYYVTKDKSVYFRYDTESGSSSSSKKLDSQSWLRKIIKEIE